MLRRVILCLVICSTSLRAMQQPERGSLKQLRALREQLRAEIDPVVLRGFLAMCEREKQDKQSLLNGAIASINERRIFNTETKTLNRIEYRMYFFNGRFGICTYIHNERPNHRYKYEEVRTGKKNVFKIEGQEAQKLFNDCRFLYQFSPKTQ